MPTMKEHPARLEALKLGKPCFYTGEPCRHGHDAERFVCGGCTCVVCCTETFRQMKRGEYVLERRKAALRAKLINGNLEPTPPEPQPWD